MEEHLEETTQFQKKMMKMSLQQIKNSKKKLLDKKKNGPSEEKKTAADTQIKSATFQQVDDYGVETDEK